MHHNHKLQGLNNDNLQFRDARDSNRDAIQLVTLPAYEHYAALVPVNQKYYRENILATLAEVNPAEQIVHPIGS